MPSQTIEKAKAEIKSVLKRYQVSWDEVAPDQDEETWKEIEPTVRKVRKELFRKTYPDLQ